MSDRLVGTERSDVLDAALRYAALGWRVVPIRPGSKHPPMKIWQRLATTDVDKINAWWSQGGRYDVCGVGIVTGAASGVFVLDADTRDDKDGAVALAALIAAHDNDWPVTVQARTGSGSAHYLFAWPIGQDVRNSASHRLGAGLDIRGEGGQIVAAPTRHPNGSAYRWVDGHAPDQIALAPAPDWLLDLLAEPAGTTRLPHPAGTNVAPTGDDDDSPAAWFNNTTSWDELLRADGWSSSSSDNGEQRWTRPGKARREGISATTGHNGRDVLKVFTSSVPDLEADRAYSRFGYWAATRHHGNRSACARALRASMGGTSARAPFELPWQEPEDESATNSDDSSTSDDGLRFGPRGAVLCAELACRVRDDVSIALGAHGALWRYQGGVYRSDGEAWARNRARELLGDRFARRHLDEMLSWMRAHLPVIELEPNTRWINCANGMLDWRSGELLAHDASYHSIWQLPVAWPDSARSAELILDFFAQVVPVEVIDFMCEVIGYALYSGNPLRKAVLLRGPGRNGKSTWLGLLRALLGNDNVSVVPLQTLAENRFAGAELYGKAANICGDLDARAVRRTDLFKALTGGDPIFTERKYGDPFSFICWALPLFATNEPPAVFDRSPAWFDRWLVLPFDRRIDEHDVDPFLLGKLTQSEQLEGLLYLAVCGLQTLMRRGRFELPDVVEAAGNEYRDSVDPIRAFVTERCCFADDVFLSRADLYRGFRTFCGEEGLEVVSARTFVNELRRWVDTSDKTATERMRHGVRGWAGIGWST